MAFDFIKAFDHSYSKCFGSRIQIHKLSAETVYNNNNNNRLFEKILKIEKNKNKGSLHSRYYRNIHTVNVI